MKLQGADYEEAWRPWGLLMAMSCGILITAGACAAVFLLDDGSSSKEERIIGAAIVAAVEFLLVLATISLRTYRVRVTDSELVVGFESWILRRRIALSEITTVEEEEIRWVKYCGLGVRWAGHTGFVPDCGGTGLRVKTKASTTSFRTKDAPAVQAAIRAHMA